MFHEVLTLISLDNNVISFCKRLLGNKRNTLTINQFRSYFVFIVKVHLNEKSNRSAIPQDFLIVKPFLAYRLLTLTGQDERGLLISFSINLYQ